MPQHKPEIEPLLTPAETAEMFRVQPRTVVRWVKQGRLSTRLTAGGHHRLVESEVRALLARESR